MFKNRLTSTILSPVFIIGLMWIMATLFNVNKAFHIDDTFHLEATQWIKNNPLQPMSGEINWRNNPAKLYTSNQPPLYFYLLAGIDSLFETNEVVLHLFQSLFTLLAISLFFAICKWEKVKRPLLLTFLFAVNPAFVLNQNLMIDVPLLAFELLFIYQLLKAKDAPQYFIYASCVFAIMMLLKYTALPLGVLLILAVLFSKRYKYLWVLIIPFLLVALWSLENLWEFNQIHIFNRSPKPLNLRLILKHAVIITQVLGAVIVFSFTVLNGIHNSKFSRRITWVLPAVFMGFATLVYFKIVSETWSNYILIAIFIANGLFIVSLIAFRLLKFNQITSNYNALIFTFWLAGLGAFILLFAPFIATRHLLLFMPAGLLLLNSYISNATPFVRHSTVITSLAFTVLLGISDWHYADYYRQKAHSINLSEQGKTFTVGHWGWQWYSQKRGMEVYATQSSIAKVGDYIISALDTEGQEINDSIIIKEIDRIVEPISIAQFFSVNRAASFYGSTFSMPPWRLSKAPVDTIVTYQVIDIIK